MGDGSARISEAGILGRLTVILSKSGRDPWESIQIAGFSELLKNLIKRISGKGFIFKFLKIMIIGKSFIGSPVPPPKIPDQRENNPEEE